LSYVSVFFSLKHNGPAIWGGCVTRSCPDRSVGGKHWAGSWYLASGETTKLSRCKEGMAWFLPFE